MPAKKAPKEPAPAKKAPRVPEVDAAPAKRARSSSSNDVAADDKKKKQKKAKATMSVVEVEPVPAPPEPASKKGEKASVTSPPAVSPSAALLSSKGAKSENRLDRDQILRAVRALLTHVKRTKRSELLDDEDGPVNVLIGTKQMPKAVGKAAACKPVPLPLPFPFISLDTAEICLITKDPQRTYKDRLADAGLRAKVIGVSKLKKKYHPYEAKRELCAAYDVFLADAAILPMLPPLLGKVFFEKKKLPTAVDLKKKDIRAEMSRAACGTLFRHATGTSNSLQVGTSEQTAEHLVENIVTAVELAVAQIPGKWTNIQSLQLRTTNSVALPFYSALPHA